MTGPGSARYSSARVVVDAAVADVHPVHYAPYRINLAAILVESTRSQNITMTCRRSRAASGAAETSGGRAAVAIGTAVAGSITGAAAGGATGAGQAQSPVRRGAQELAVHSRSQMQLARPQTSIQNGRGFVTTPSPDLSPRPRHGTRGVALGDPSPHAGADPDRGVEVDGHSGLVAPRDCLHRGDVHEGRISADVVGWRPRCRTRWMSGASTAARRVAGSQKRVCEGRGC